VPKVEALDVWRILKGAGVRRLKFVIVDVYGKPRGVSLGIEEAKRALEEGVSFDGSSVAKYAEVHESDVTAVPDFSSVYVDPFDRSAWVFCRVEDPPRAAGLDPRSLLARTVERLGERGLKARVGIEVEFFLVKVEGGRVEPADWGGYFDLSQPELKVAEEIEEAAEAAGLGGSKVHHEVAPGQYEYNLPAGDPMRTADSFLFFKHLASQVARARGLRATFMPKPFWGVNGSGAHVHLNFLSRGEDVFGKDGSLTAAGLHCLAGILKRARALAALAAPTVNSYKRLVPHHEAPTRLVWGYSNRSALVRIPRYRSAVNRIEVREPDPMMNPYLTLAALLEAAVSGLERGEEPPEPVALSAYSLATADETPPHLAAAVAELEAAYRQLGLPDELADVYAKLKKAEWSEYVEACGPWEETWNRITEWEYKRYL
jgi:glutamine synthetase